MHDLLIEGGTRGGRHQCAGARGECRGGARAHRRHRRGCDPDTVGRGAKRRVWDLPAGASRVDTPALGLHAVWVNGMQVVDEYGPIADAGRPGRLMREFDA